jgi:pimeloyl-ACP methyl ester carboxylesterase
MNLLVTLRVWLAALILASVLIPASHPQPAASQERFSAAGGSAATAELEGVSMKVFTYRPQGCAAPSVLVVFHGNGRGAESYRDSAQAVADRSCFVVYSPLFDEDRFPSWRYHRGGVSDGGERLDPEDWTIELVDEMIDWIRKREPADVPIYLFGHSAGAQFLSRYAAYSAPLRVARIILANPSTYVLPTLAEDAPYGFGALFDGLDARALMRGYLEAPITIYLGAEDTGSEDLTMNAQARRQGDNRLDRGRRTFQLARDVARDEGWEFGWTFVEAENVGHTARGMLNSAEILEALGFAGIRFE